MISKVCSKSVVFAVPDKDVYLEKRLGSFITTSLAPEYADKIRCFIKDFTCKSAFQLLIERKEMEARKSELAAVHTLVHIAYLMSEPDLKQTLQNLRQSEIKWGMFINGMGESIQRRKAGGTLDEYVSSFSSFLRADEQVLRKFLDEKEFKKMFDYLLDL